MACDQWSELLLSNTHLFPIVSYFIHTWPTWYSEWEFPKVGPTGKNSPDLADKCCTSLLGSTLSFSRVNCDALTPLWLLLVWLLSLAVDPLHVLFPTFFITLVLQGTGRPPSFGLWQHFVIFFPLFFRGPLHDCYLGCVWMLSYPSQRSLWNENFSIQYIWFHVQ